ncbi:uncharacterized protein [Rutidosis leptorrhynchoides]|uniref:uncharacterized protein n=1 Tax=Rutidosis leptorrhynchoides TaxID=125765 RepID=UPI003A9A5FE1
MDPPSLKLVLLKGPREGESVEFRFGETVKVGRVVRGNNLPIKDAGISTKHLVIESVRESNKWALTDLESSNGTILNEVQLSPLTPVDLNDGDMLKIGEYTSIMVKIVDSVGEENLKSKSRRNPTRRGRAKNPVVEEEISKGLERVDVGEESRLQQSPEKQVGMEKLKIKVELETEEVLDDNTITQVEVNRLEMDGGVVESVVVRDNEAETMDQEKGNEEVQKKTRGKPPRRGRGRGRGRGRVGNAKWKEQDEVVELVNIAENDDLNVGVHEEGYEKGVELVNEEHVNVRIDSSGREPQNEDRLEEENDNVEVIGVSDSKEKENVDVIGDSGSRKTGNSNVDAVMGVDDEEEEVVASEEKTDGGDDRPEFGKEVDLEKMTLGEWLDYLEVMLPKQIRERNDKIIEEMRAKAERTRKYMAEQKRKKEMA